MPSRLAITAVVLTAGLAGCTRLQPEFVEPAWGDAPAPLVAEVTEVTLEHRHCATGAPRCITDRLVFRRDGKASRTLLTGNTRDSLMLGRVDSAAFARLVEVLRTANHFHGRADRRHEPLTVDSYLVTAASLCRRAITNYPRFDQRDDPTPPVPAAILETASQVRWSKCCRA
jgi:hypothetical protein